MLNELVKRFSQSSDRRTGDRHRKRFNMAWLRGTTLVPAIGLEIGEKGILFTSKEAPSGTSADVAMDLGGRRVRARLTIARQGSLPRDGVEWPVVAGVFQGIAADDWDVVVRFCRGLEDPGNKAANELQALASTPDDAYRLLPLRVQERVVSTLIAAGRLAPQSDSKNPLLRMSYVGHSRKGNTHRLSVHSRYNIGDEVRHFDSILTVDDAGNVSLDK